MARVQITSPDMFEVVNFESTVSGKITPANLPVQVYIMAADGKWYLQKPVVKDGNMWSVSCHFGNPIPEDTVYTVIAVITEDRPTTPLEVLPENACQSDALAVIRKWDGGDMW